MRVLFACGGTAGHINPAVGVASQIKKICPDSEFLFIGAEGKMEMDLVPREGFQIRGVKISSLSRSLSKEGLHHNAEAVKELASAVPACKKIIREFQPDVVIGTGGYVCYPVLAAAHRLGIPTAVHESNAEPGLTTRMLEGSVNLIMVGFEEARKNYRHPDKVVVTGTPVRSGFTNADKAKAKKALHLKNDKPLVVSVWGSLGATDMNKTMARVIGLAMEQPNFRMVHSAGARGFDSMTLYMQNELQLTGWEEAGFDVKDYIYDMARWMSSADLVICRSGASTLAELTALGKPALLVPSPNVVNNHQEKNARVLEKAGGAKVLLEKDASAENLLKAIQTLLQDSQGLEKMSQNMLAMSVSDSTEKIAELVMNLAGKK